MAEFLNREQLAKVFNCSARTIENWKRQGLPFVKVGALVRYDKEAATAWFLKHSQSAAESKPEAK